MDSSGSIEIRVASVEDLKAVMAIERDSFTDPWTADAIFGELLADRMRLPLVAEIRGEMAGYLMAWLVVDQLHILNIATAKPYLRRGVASALLLEAARRGAARKAREVTLEVRESNYSARDFYKRWKFAEVGVRPGYYQDNGEDAIIMTVKCSLLLDD